MMHQTSTTEYPGSKRAYLEKSFRVKPHVVVHSRSTSYLVQKCLGDGSFGRVFKCTNLYTNEDVAIKFIGRSLWKDGKQEAKVLKKLRKLDPEENNIIKFYEQFKYKGHCCLVFEWLDRSLYDLMVERQHKPLHVSEIRYIAQQLLVALAALSSIGLTHADIKLDNILLVNHKKQPFKVKICDFGLSSKSSALWYYGTFQVCSLRAPEIFLGLPLSESVDMWSLGSALVNLYIGKYLIPYNDKYEVMRTIHSLIGFPQYLLDKGCKTELYFKKTVRLFYGPIWKLKTKKEFSGSEEVIVPPHSYRELCSLNDLPKMHLKAMVPTEHEDTNGFLSLLKKMLTVDPAKRISAAEALNHPFISQRVFSMANNFYVTKDETEIQISEAEEEEIYTSSAAKASASTNLRNKSTAGVIKNKTIKKSSVKCFRKVNRKMTPEATSSPVKKYQQQEGLPEIFTIPTAINSEVTYITLFSRHKACTQMENTISDSLKPTSVSSAHTFTITTASTTSSSELSSKTLSPAMSNTSTTSPDSDSPHEVCKEVENVAHCKETTQTRRCTGDISAADNENIPVAKTTDETTTAEVWNTATTSPVKEEQSHFVEVKTRKTFWKRFCNFFSSLFSCCRGTDEED